MEIFDAYSHALLALAGYAFVALALGPMAGLARLRAGLAPGAMPVADYSHRDYRICRAYQNTVENAGLFGCVVGAAVLAGAAPFWVNVLASGVLVVRMAMILVHILAIGAAENGPRTVLFALGTFMMMGLALMAIFAVL